MLIKLSFVLFAVIGIGHIVWGVVYVTADQFMSYHAQALSTRWGTLDSNYQTLFLALIKLAGAGGLVAGVVNLSLVFYFLRNTISSLIWLLPTTALIFQLATNYVVYTVYTFTPGEPPLLMVSVVTGILIIATVMLFFGLGRDYEHRAQDADVRQ